MPRGMLPISRQEIARALKIDPDAIHSMHVDPERDRLILVLNHAKARQVAEHEPLPALALHPEQAPILFPSGPKKQNWFHRLISGDAQPATRAPSATNGQQQSVRH